MIDDDVQADSVKTGLSGKIFCGWLIANDLFAQFGGTPLYGRNSRCFFCYFGTGCEKAKRFSGRKSEIPSMVPD
ncbi:hypothetical protein WH50_10200 [Pokkaliibacter plantistimulans]|uniref:Uncharacterized protein n=1 Tax=Pokkaliibacter plantistimulans TaxID=1635171 RepID=A0ABX5M0W6_9GAMM|nr:hypothetical protein [Pokkaliibacter plantistimulans]PXF31373.1 hypothetical protein WH50_10200 [Pokkaliibacter plantistimulans]